MQAFWKTLESVSSNAHLRRAKKRRGVIFVGNIINKKSHELLEYFVIYGDS